MFNTLLVSSDRRSLAQLERKRTGGGGRAETVLLGVTVCGSALLVAPAIGTPAAAPSSTAMYSHCIDVGQED